MKTIYVGNLTFAATEQDVQELFEEVGPVESVKLITDRETGRARGFGFIEMEDDVAEQAIESLDGKEFQGRNLRVNMAKEKKPRRDNRFGGSRGGGGGGGSYNRGF